MERWFIKNKKDPGIDYKKLGINNVIYKILINREINTEEEIKSFLDPMLSNLNSPILLKDMVKASNLILSHIAKKNKVRIIGDYDVDGVTSTYILYSGLNKIGADVSYDIPHRVEDGYGINNNLIDRAYNDGVKLIITCDNGIAARDAVLYAKSKGIDIIITDHHEVPKKFEKDKEIELIPDANAVIDPKQNSCNYPFAEICGAVVAFKLIEYLFLIKGVDKDEFYESFLPFAAIATVCDVMPLKNENRIIVSEGLKYLRDTKHRGLNALIEVSNIKKNDMDVYHLGFIIGPTINSSGRLDSAKDALELLLENNYDLALEKAKKLRELNYERQKLTTEAFDIIDEKIIRENLLDKHKVLILYEEGLNESILGIVAGKIKEKYYRPTVVLSNSKDLIKGSGRSIEEYNMFQEFSKSKEFLTTFGGHKMACGLSMPLKSLDEFIKDVDEKESLTKEDLIRKVYIDGNLELKYISMNLVKEIERLAPFGNGNSAPKFGSKNLKINNLNILGKNKNFLKMRLFQNNINYTATLFEDYEIFLNNLAKFYGREEVMALLQGRPSNIFIDIVFNLELNIFNGNTSIQLKINNYRITGENNVN
ncbi:single-stranded-DNA-specific exonuclease RecJ [Peptoniphilus sp. AGMB00490]|uniref:Single-stranded-DNA-specific exonuclease RecJ n=1 Tax=Peptoniphilus faecalis TaxID=2731255 RepID=A0A848RHA2_9FIRM|nr:single-stranded-DNA-specific exonuclease RecJ [Peptoniphilus faecalis]NMW84636.1 single-stranded-DNA-specific exonuclease RecJ [Peptoniphilus faecalis]